MDALTAKPIYKVYYQNASVLDRADMEGPLAWLTNERFQAKTEGLVIAAQDEILYTNQYKHTILKMSATSTC